MTSKGLQALMPVFVALALGASGCDLDRLGSDI